MGSGRHSSDEELDFSFLKYVLIVIVIIAIIVGIIFGTKKIISKINENKTEAENASAHVVQESKYDILGKIIIDKINVEQNIFDTVQEEALEEGVIKLYGDTLNGEGNFCIAGHNYDNIFKKLDELEIGDEFEISDKNNEKTKYKIIEIESVEPTDMQMLMSEEGKTQITLITCENYSTKRLIVKAEMDK